MSTASPKTTPPPLPPFSFVAFTAWLYAIGALASGIYFLWREGPGSTEFVFGLFGSVGALGALLNPALILPQLLRGRPLRGILKTILSGALFGGAAGAIVPFIAAIIPAYGAQPFYQGPLLPLWLLAALIAGFFTKILNDRLRAYFRSILQKEIAKYVPPAIAAKDPTVEKPAASLTAEDTARLVEQEKRLRKNFQSDPENVRLGHRLIYVQRSLGLYEDAAAVYDALIALEPENLEFIREKAQLYLELKDTRRYVKTLEQLEQIQARTAFHENIGVDLTLKTFKVEDLAFFEDFTWSFRPKVNVLLGKNGYGKSHLLRLIAGMLQNEEKITGEYFRNCGRNALVQVDIDKNQQTESSIRRVLVFEKSLGKIPVLAMPDVRSIDKSADSVGAANNEFDDLRSHGAWHFLNHAPYGSRITNFLYDLCFHYYDQGKSFDQPLFVLVQDVFKKLTATGFTFHEVVKRDNGRFELLVRTEGSSTPLPLQKASQGTLSVLAMIGITYSFLRALHSGGEESKVTQQQAIVIIDEIDAHLHPTWQQKILQVLRATFPNVQFIVTAHSPLVIAGCMEGEVAIMKRGEKKFTVEVQEGHFIGATAEDLYQQVFRIEARDHTYNRLNTLSSKRAEIEHNVKEMESKTPSGSSPSDELEAMKAELYYLERFSEVREKKEQAEQLEQRWRELDLENQRLSGSVDTLKTEADVSGRKARVSLTFLSAFIGRLESLQPNALEEALRTLGAQSSFEEALFLLDNLSRLDKKHLRLFGELARQRSAAGAHKQAAAALQSALLIDPHNPEFRAAMEQVQNELRRASAKA